MKMAEVGINTVIYWFIRRMNGSIQGVSVVCRVYDEIDAAGSFPGRAPSHEVPLSETWSWPKKWLVEIIRLTYHKEQFYENFRDPLRAAARKSIRDVGYSRDAKLVRVGDDRFSDAIVLVKNGIECITEQNIKLDVQQFLSHQSCKGIFPGKTVADTRLNSEIIGKSLGRLPFVTRKGHSVLSSEHVEQGDVVALIKGTQVPFILRRRTSGA